MDSRFNLESTDYICKSGQLGHRRSKYGVRWPFWILSMMYVYCLSETILIIHAFRIQLETRSLSSVFITLYRNSCKKGCVKEVQNRCGNQETLVKLTELNNL